MKGLFPFAMFSSSLGAFLQWESHLELYNSRKACSREPFESSIQHTYIILSWFSESNEIASAEGVIPSGWCQGVSHARRIAFTDTLVRPAFPMACPWHMLAGGEWQARVQNSFRNSSPSPGPFALSWQWGQLLIQVSMYMDRTAHAWNWACP